MSFALAFIRALRSTPALIFYLIIIGALACLVGALVARGEEPASSAAIPATAAARALEDWTANGRNPNLVYLWSPTASDEEFKAAVVALNLAANQSSTAYEPPRVSGGALLQVDLTQLVDDEAQLSRLATVWNSLATSDPYFHFHVTQELAGNGKQAPAAKGQTQTTKTKNIVVTAPWTGEAGAALGVGRIYRVDFFTWAACSSVDGGHYLAFRGLQPGKTTLEEYLTSRGASLRTAEKLNAVDQGVQISGVTGKVRQWELWHGQANKPSNGSPLVSITKDVKDGALDPNRNAYLSLLNERFDAYELIVTLADGQQEFTLWDGEQKLLAEAAPNVAADHRIPEPFTKRLQAPGGCIRCHGPFEGLQPIRNDVLTMVGAQGRILTDVSKGQSKQLEALRTIQSRFGAKQHDVDGAIANARESLDRRFDGLLPQPPDDKKDHSKAAKEAYAAAMAVYDRYQYEFVTPAAAARELGFTGNDGAKTLQNALPAPNMIGAIAEGSAGTLARLEAGIAITRDEFNQAYPDLITKAMATFNK